MKWRPKCRVRPQIFCIRIGRSETRPRGGILVPQQPPSGDAKSRSGSTNTESLALTRTRTDPGRFCPWRKAPSSPPAQHLEHIRGAVSAQDTRAHTDSTSSAQIGRTHTNLCEQIHSRTLQVAVDLVTFSSDSLPSGESDRRTNSWGRRA